MLEPFLMFSTNTGHNNRQYDPKATAVADRLVSRLKSSVYLYCFKLKTVVFNNISMGLTFRFHACLLSLFLFCR